MAAGTALPRLGALWQQRIDSLREYEVVRDGNMVGSNLFRGSLASSEHAEARRMLSTLLEREKGRAFDEVFAGRVATNDAGSVSVIQSCHPLQLAQVDTERYIWDMEHDLTLVHGIGQATERRLKARGYATLHDLARHPRFRLPAARVIRTIGTCASSEIMGLAGRRHSWSHPLVLGAAGFHEPEDYCFLDIETLGLFSRPIILIGIGTMEGRHLSVSQYLLRSIDEEPAALLASLSHLSQDRPALVTYNGKSFDLPYLQDRLSYYGLGTVSPIPHFDLLHFTRARWRDRYPSLRLTALEKEVFGISRTGDIPGQMVPEFYEAYLKSGNCGPLVPIVEHNRQDVISLALLFFRLIGEMHGGC